MKVSVLIITIILLTSCGSGKVLKEQDNLAYQNLKDLANSKMFMIDSHTARPMATNSLNQLINTNILGPGNTSSNINLIGNQNILEVKNDSVRAFLPYYGEQNFGGGTYLGTRSAIEFRDIPTNYKATFDDNKQRVIIKFEIEDQYRQGEQYNIYITLFKNFSSTISVQSSYRTPITFSGNVKRITGDMESL